MCPTCSDIYVASNVPCSVVVQEFSDHKMRLQLALLIVHAV